MTRAWARRSTPSWWPALGPRSLLRGCPRVVLGPVVPPAPWSGWNLLVAPSRVPCRAPTWRCPTDSAVAGSLTVRSAGTPSGSARPWLPAVGSLSETVPGVCWLRRPARLLRVDPRLWSSRPDPAELPAAGRWLGTWPWALGSRRGPHGVPGRCWCEAGRPGRPALVWGTGFRPSRVCPADCPWGMPSTRAGAGGRGSSTALSCRRSSRRMTASLGSRAP